MKSTLTILLICITLAGSAQTTAISKKDRDSVYLKMLLQPYDRSKSNGHTDWTFPYSEYIEWMSAQETIHYPSKSEIMPDISRKEFQSPFDNSFAIAISPGSWGWGARYEHRFGFIGAYVYGTMGDYPETPSFINKEATIGGGIVLAPNQSYVNYYPAFTFGLNYSEYTYYESAFPIIDTHADDMMSLDFGLSAQHGRVNFGINADILKWKMTCFLGFNF